MKISDKLYGLNASISALYISQKKSMRYSEVLVLNKKLGEIIKEVRNLEESLSERDQN